MPLHTLSDLEPKILHAMTVRDPALLRELQPHIRALDEPLSQALDTYTTGLIAEFTGDLENALSRYHQALGAFRDRNATGWQARVHTNIGAVNYFRSDFAGAMAEFRRSIDLRDENDPDVSINLNNIGAVYYNVGDYPNALEYFERAYRSHLGRSAPISASGSLMNMGNVFSSMEDLDHALEMYQQALALQEEHGTERDAFMTICNIALNRIHSHRPEEAEQALDRAEQIARAEDNAPMLERVFSLRIQLLRLTKRYDEAAAFIEEHQFLNTPGIPFRVNAYKDMGLICRERGDLVQAISYFEQALELSEQHELRSYIDGIHGELMELAKQSGDLDRYIRHNERYMQIKEEVRGKEASVKIAMYAKERELDVEREEARKHRALLYSTLPASIAERMLHGEDVSGDHHDHASVLFLDIVGFTTHSTALSPQETTTLLAQIFDRFDDICREYNVTKIKTIGDSYMCFAHSETGDRKAESDAAERIAAVALAMQNVEFYWPRRASPQGSPEGSLERLAFRIGIHSGPVVAGVIGKQRLQYDVWGDTVNTASRMESTGEAGRIQVSSPFATALGNGESGMGNAAEAPVIPSASEEPHSPLPITYSLRERGAVEVKGKGTMTTYWLEGASPQH